MPTSAAKRKPAHAAKVGTGSSESCFSAWHNLLALVRQLQTRAVIIPTRAMVIAPSRTLSSMLTALAQVQTSARLLAQALQKLIPLPW